MSACVCVLGVAWLGTTFVAAHIDEINVFAGNLLESKPWMLAVVLFFAAMLLYSQAGDHPGSNARSHRTGRQPGGRDRSFFSCQRLVRIADLPDAAGGHRIR